MAKFACLFWKAIFLLSIIWTTSLEAQRFQEIISIHNDDFEPIVLDTIMQYAFIAEEDINILDSSRRSKIEWKTYSQVKDSLTGKFILTRFNIQNSSDEKTWNVIKVNAGVDSLRLYKLVGEEISLVGLTGRHIPKKQRYFSFQESIIPINLQAKEAFNFYLFIVPNTNSGRKSRISLQLEPLKTVINERLHVRGIQYLSEGLILLFAFISLFLFFSFRERDFIYFFFLVLGITGFVQNGEGFIGAVIPSFVKEAFNGWSGGEASLIGVIVLFASLFISSQLNLKIYWYKFWRIYTFFWISLLVLFVFSSVFITNLEAGRVFGVIIMLLLLCFTGWLILTFIAVIQGVMKKRKNARVLLVAIAIFIVLPIILSMFSAQSMKSVQVKATIFTTLVPFFGVLMYGMFSRINQIINDRISLKVGKEKSDELLYNILPHEIATELIEKGESEARMIDQVTVLFTDFEGFTEKATELGPTLLVEEINTCFKAFDNFCEEFGVEKIKTIGDSYMAAGGLNNDEPGFWVKKVINAGLAMNEFMKERKQINKTSGRPFFEMRLGINTGPIVAGVVGVKKFQYDLWGDTVNIASRMESYGETEHVNISQETYEFVKDDPEFEFEKREIKEIKGKGVMQMWFVKKSKSNHK